MLAWIERNYSILAICVLALAMFPAIAIGRMVNPPSIEYFAYYNFSMVFISILAAGVGILFFVRAIRAKLIRYSLSLMISIALASIPWIGMILGYLAPLTTADKPERYRTAPPQQNQSISDIPQKSI